jgi:hypothetical protein
MMQNLGDFCDYHSKSCVNIPAYYDGNTDSTYIHTKESDNFAEEENRWL